MGVANWTGTPEEATNMLRAAAHGLGCDRIGVMELTANTRKMFQPNRVRLENVDLYYLDKGVDVLPNKCQWLIAYRVGQSTEMTKRGDTQQNTGSGMGYSFGPILQTCLQRFIKSLGYQAIAGPGGVNSSNVGLGALTGTGELSRIGMQLTYEYGMMIRYTPGIVTDLPLAPTRPIDAGLFRFCKTCKLCGMHCNEVNGWTPINMDDEPTWEVPGPSNRIGVKKYPMQWGRCIFCPYCMANCPWGTHNMSNIHEIVKVIAATTPIFNSFFFNMEYAFGYGMHDSPELCEDWWNRNLNTWQHDCIYGRGTVKP